MQKRWYKNWCFNRAVILSYLMDIVVRNSGCLVREIGYHSYEQLYEIRNSTVADMIAECTCEINKIKGMSKAHSEEKQSAREKYLAKKESTLRGLKRYENRCIITEMQVGILL